MTLKETLKKAKLNESTISMLLGALVIIVVGVAAVNYLGNGNTGETIPAIESEDLSFDLDGRDLPTQHTVEAGEDLWKISEQYYDSGYNWVAIAEANDISNPNQLSEGDTITIPAVDTGEVVAATPTPETIAQADPEPTDIPAATSIPRPTEEPTNAPTIAEQIGGEEVVTGGQESIGGETYTVVRGDTLWSIAQRAYGDPYRWVDIASANDLVNPDVIHAGNVFSIPR